MATANPTECGVCQESFGEELRSPRNLPCSHHMCGVCIDQLIRGNNKLCPFCRQKFDAKSSQDLMLNYGVLDCIKYMTLQNVSSTKSSSQGKTYQQRVADFKEGTVEGTSEVLKELLKLKNKNKGLLLNMTDLKSSLNQESTDMKEKLISQISNVAARLDETAERLDPAVMKLQEQLKHIEAKEEVLTSLMQKLDMVSSFGDAASVVEEAEETNITISDWTKNVKLSLAEDDGQLYTAIKEVGASKNMKKDLMAAMGIEEQEQNIQPPPRDVSSVEQEDLSSQVTARALWQMRQPVKRLVQEGRILAVDETYRTRRAAKITIEDNELHLHCLKSEPMPNPNCYYIPFDHILRLIGSNPSAFMDVCVNGTTLGRLRILFMNENAQPFIGTMCGSKDAVSYENIPLRVLDKGTLLEQGIFGGQITGRQYPRYNTSSIPEPLYSINDISLSNNKQQCLNICGTVAVIKISSIRSCSPPLLAIRTGPYELKNIYKKEYVSHTGKVIDGLSILCDAIHHADKVNHVTLGKCGGILTTEYPIAGP